MNNERSLKQRIRAGEIIHGLQASLDTGPDELTAAVARKKYDYIYIDGQHTAFSESGMVAFCGLAQSLDLPVIFRIHHTRHAYLIGRYLDLGILGVIVPEVEERAVVDEALAYAYYPQQGKRSWGGTARYGLNTADGPLDRHSYAAWWNDNVLVAIMPESVEAIRNIRALATPGVDFVTFGPNDLLFSIEGHPDFPMRTVEECIRHVLAELSGTGVAVAIGTAIEGDRARFQEMGVTIFSESWPGS